MTDRKVIEAGTAETVGLRAEHESAGPAQQDAPNTAQTTDNPIDLRLAYARIIDQTAWKNYDEEQERCKESPERAPQFQRWANGYVADSLAKADAILALPNPTAYARIREALERVGSSLNHFIHAMGDQLPNGDYKWLYPMPHTRVQEAMAATNAAAEALKATHLIGLSQGEGDLSERVRRLVIAARVVAYSDGQTDMTELDQAAEAFAADIAWENGDDA